MLSFVANRLIKGFQYSRSLVPNLNRRQSFKQPSSVTSHKVENLCKVIDQIQIYRQKSQGSEHNLKGNKEDAKNLDYMIIEFIKTLEKLPSDEDLSLITDDTGYNLLQKAIIARDADLVPVILDKGWSFNIGDCTFPLHLACKLGYLEIVELLFEKGAQHDIKSPVCYPFDHSPAACGSVPLVSYFRRTPKCLGNCTPELPIVYAVENDHVDIVKLLLSDSYTADATYQYQELFDSACRHGAFECMQFLIKFEGNVEKDQQSESIAELDSPKTEGSYLANLLDYFVLQNSLDINAKNVDGYTPLLLAVSQGEKYINFLIQNSANIFVKNNSSENALHILYKKNFAPLEIFNCTKLLLGSGLEQEVNAVDVHGNTALHYIISHLDHKLYDTASSDILCYDKCKVYAFEDETDAAMQSEYNQQIFKCIELLLQHNCNPNIKNKTNLSPILKLLKSKYSYTRDMFRTAGEVHHHLHAGGDGNSSATRSFHLDLNATNEALKLLLKFGALVNDSISMSPLLGCMSPLRLVLQILLNIEPSQLPLYSEKFLESVEILCSHGAETNFMLSNNLVITCVTIITALSEECLCFSSPDYTDEKKSENANFISKLLSVMLKYGMDPNLITHRRRPYLQGGMGNALVEFVQLTHNITQPSDLLYIHQWILTLMQHGANPDIEPYSSEPTICHSQSSIFLRHNKTQAVSHYMHEIKDIAAIFEDGYAEKLLMLFYNSMDHMTMYQCLNMAKTKFDCLNNAKFTQMLITLSSRPRTLKQSARIAIYKSLNRQLIGRVEKLELPKTLEAYLLNIES